MESQVGIVQYMIAWKWPLQSTAILWNCNFRCRKLLMTSYDFCKNPKFPLSNTNSSARWIFVLLHISNGSYVGKNPMSIVHLFRNLQCYSVLYIALICRGLPKWRSFSLHCQSQLLSYPYVVFGGRHNVRCRPWRRYWRRCVDGHHHFRLVFTWNCKQMLP